MYPLLGYVLFPVSNVFVQLGETLEGPPFKLSIEALYVALYLALALRTVGTRRHDRRIVMASEGHKLKIGLRVVPDGLDDRRLEIVRTQSDGNPTEVAKRVLQAPCICFAFLGGDCRDLESARRIYYLVDVEDRFLAGDASVCIDNLDFIESFVREERFCEGELGTGGSLDGRPIYIPLVGRRWIRFYAN